MMRQFQIQLFTSMVMFFTANVNASTVGMAPIISYLLSGTSSTNTQTIAIDKIKVYADNNTQTIPTVQDYIDAGIVDVTLNNIDEINIIIANLTADDVDTKEEIQALVDGSPDTTPPVIIINGSNPVTVIQNTSYTDAGATATDDRDGTITILTTGSVDTSTVGIYIITYTVTDSTGNTATETRTVQVKLNSIPVADAGERPHEYVNTTSLVTLDGNGSYDPDGDPLIYQWRVLGPTESGIGDIILSNETGPNPTFIADRDGVYEVKLIVSDGIEASEADYIFITASTSDNIYPIANAGIDQNIFTLSSIALDGAKSSDADGDDLNYGWSIVSKPVDSSATLVNSTSVISTFTADLDGNYEIQLIVNDGTFDSVEDTVTITASSIPIANAGTDQSVYKLATVRLDGSGSLSASGDEISYFWNIKSKPDGSNATLSESTIVNPTFIADVNGTYSIELIVHDGVKDSLADNIEIIAHSTRPYGIKKTGQTKSYNENGDEVLDEGLKDDGYYQKGLTPRYTSINVVNSYINVNLITDQITGLMWTDSEREPIQSYWAYETCEAWTIGGYNNWRVPTLDELLSIVDRSTSSPSINPIFSKTIPGIYVATGSRGVASKTVIWGVDFEYGTVRWFEWGDFCYYRCVRDVN